MKNTQRNIHDNLMIKWYWMKMIIQFIDDKKLLMKNDGKSNVNINDSIIDWLFHIIHIFSNVIIFISILKFVWVLIYSNIFLNIYIKVIIE